MQPAMHLAMHSDHAEVCGRLWPKLDALCDVHVLGDHAVRIYRMQPLHAAHAMVLAEEPDAGQPAAGGATEPRCQRVAIGNHGHASILWVHAMGLPSGSSRQRGQRRRRLLDGSTTPAGRTTRKPESPDLVREWYCRQLTRPAALGWYAVSCAWRDARDSVPWRDARDSVG